MANGRVSTCIPPWVKSRKCCRKKSRNVFFETGLRRLFRKNFFPKRYFLMLNSLYRVNEKFINFCFFCFSLKNYHPIFNAEFEKLYIFKKNIRIIYILLPKIIIFYIVFFCRETDLLQSGFSYMDHIIN